MRLNTELPIPEAAAPIRSLDRLLLDEANHRTGNEVAAALAALRLVSSARGSKSRWRLLAEAIDRLEGFGRVHVLLGRPVRGSVDLGRDLEELCRSMLASRFSAGDARVEMRLPSMFVDGATARTAMLICAELVANAVHHVLSQRGGLLEVELERLGDDIIIGVADDGPGLAAPSAASGTGLGSGIVADLVGRANGAIECDTGPHGTRFLVRLPFDPASAAVCHG